MGFLRRDDDFDQLEHDLRALRTEPSSRFVSALAERARTRSQRRHPRARFVLVGALGAAVLAASASANIFTIADNATTHVASVVKHLAAAQPPKHVNGAKQLSGVTPAESQGDVQTNWCGTATGPFPASAPCKVEVDPDDPGINEGTPPAKTLTAVTFTLTMIGGKIPNTDITVCGVPADGTATLANNDYQATGTNCVTIPAWSTTGVTVTPVNIVADSTPEADETFDVVWNPGANAIMDNDDHQNTVKIKNDDGAVPPGSVTVQMTCTPATVNQPTSGTATTTCTITLNNNPPSPGVTVSYSTEDDTATAGTDYTAIPPTTHTFTGTSKTFSFNVTVLGEAKNSEGDEQFFVNVASNSSNATVMGSGQVKIKVHQP